MALTFIGVCPEGYEIDHNDINSMNNHYTNLLYATKSENCKNRRTQFGYQMTYVNEIEDECVEFTEYNNHRFENLLINPNTL